MVRRITSTSNNKVCFTLYDLGVLPGGTELYFRMCRNIICYLWEKLKPMIFHQDTNFRKALPVEKRVTITL